MLTRRQNFLKFEVINPYVIGNAYWTVSEIFLVDYFRKNLDRPSPLACFLSHVHSDHLSGLESLRSPFVYCSAATKEVSTALIFLLSINPQCISDPILWTLQGVSKALPLYALRFTLYVLLYTSAELLKSRYFFASRNIRTA